MLIEEGDNFFSEPNKPVNPAAAIIIHPGKAEPLATGINKFSLNDLFKTILADPMPSKRIPAAKLLNNMPGDPFPVSIAFKSLLFCF